jgi:hypothetical protein
VRPEAIDTAADVPSGLSGRSEADFENRALIALARTTQCAQRTAGRQHAAFIAQLVAAKDQHPQTRQLRRADPGIASAAYRATAALKRVQ